MTAGINRLESEARAAPSLVRALRDARCTLLFATWTSPQRRSERGPFCTPIWGPFCVPTDIEDDIEVMRGFYRPPRRHHTHGKTTNSRERLNERSKHFY